MLKITRKFHKIFDNLEEPYRFLIFCAIIMPIILFISLPSTPLLTTIAWLALLVIAADRIVYVEGYYKE